MTKHVKRRERKKLARRLRKGLVDLRVLGSEKNGFNLCGFLDGGLVSFSQSFDRQKDAIAEGELKFGQKAKKLQKAAA